MIEKAVNSGSELTLNFCSLKSLSSLEGSTVTSADPSSLNPRHATSPNFLTSSALVVL